VKALPVVPKQPLENLVFGLTARVEALAMQPFDLQ
jgi:hypothetical protein